MVSAIYFLHNTRCDIHAGSSLEVPSNDDVDAVADKTYEANAAAAAEKRDASPTFRLGRRSGAQRLGLRSAYDNFLMNDDDDRLSAGENQVDVAEGPTADKVVVKKSYDSAYNDFGDDWWPVADDDILVHKKDMQPTFRLGRAFPTFRLGKRSSNPTFRLGKRADRMRVVE